MSIPETHFGRRGTTMAVTCVAAIGGALAMMYGMGRDTKAKEGRASVYKDNKGPSGGSDVSMTSSDVAAAVSVPKPGKDRLTTSGK